MSAVIETVGFCPQYFSTWTVKGSKDNVYTVQLGGTSFSHCTCPAFKYSGEPGDQDCKHVRKIWEHACLYNPQWKDAGPNDYLAYGIECVDMDRNTIKGDICPGCGQDMVPVRIAV